MLGKGLKYISAELAQKIDLDLMGYVGFKVYQLMELAGLSVAQSVNHFFEHKLKAKPREKINILTICGPGNNGGDGLVAARHLRMFNFKSQVFYPKRPDKELLKGMVTLAQYSGVGFLDTLPPPETLSKEYDILVDAIFGFSFKGEIREPFKTIIQTMGDSKVPICSVDIPSGWDVDKGNVYNTFSPSALVSLTIPKQCAEHYEGVHYIGGRFVLEEIIKKYGLEMPKYNGGDQFGVISGI